MQKLLPACFIFLLFNACSSDHDDTITGDSIIDTSMIAADVTDTFHIGTGDTSRTYYDCSVLAKSIPSETQQEEIRRDLGKLIHCGIDSFDFLYVVPNLFSGFVSENHISGKKVTYADFVKHVDEFKTTESYFQLHQRVQTLDSLRTIKFDVTKLYTMKPTLGKLGFTGPEWEMFSGFARTYPAPKTGFYTWGDLLDAFDTYKPK
jgi:hypothetical protein